MSMSSPYPPSRPDSQIESSGMVPGTPSQDTQFLEPPRASYLEQTPEPGSDSPRGSVALHSAGNASPLLSQDEKRFSEAFADPAPELLSAEPSRKRSILTRPIFWAVASLSLAIVVVAVVVPVYFLVIKPHSNLSSSPSTPSGAGGGGGGSGGPSGKSLTTGGNGSTVTTSDGSTFTYINNFGGFCEFAYSSVVS